MRAIDQLAEATGRSERQVRTAVHSLAAHGLVVTEKTWLGWAGEGRYGPLVALGSTWRRTEKS